MSDSPRTKKSSPADSNPNRSASQPTHWYQWPAYYALWGLGLAGVGVLSLLLLGGLAFAIAYPKLPEISGLTDYRPKLPMRVYSADNVLLDEFGQERRSFVPIAEIPKVMQNAILSIEDSRFYQHSGVDFKGILRASLAQLKDAGRQGASTITMQVARNFYLSSEKTFIRKIYEVLLALKIESQLSKEQILEIYMNQIFLGQRAYGFAAASEIYFGKPLSSITIAEAAMLAGLPKAPSTFNPIVKPERATLRQQYIIDRMLENGFITADEHASAKKQELKYRTEAENTVHAEYITEAARQMMFAQYGEEAYHRGLNVYLTIKASEQTVAYRALRKGILDFERRQPYRGPEAYVDLPSNNKDLDTRVAEALQNHPDSDEILAAVALEAGTKKVTAMLQDGETIQITGEGLRTAQSSLGEKSNVKTRIRAGAVLRVVKGTKGEWSITQMPEVEGAFVAIDPRTGGIRAMVGGFDYAKNKFNHVTQAWRQPGSSFKPFIYSASLEKGFTPATVINDSAIFYNAGATGSQPWEPKNYDGTFEGPMSMRRGLAKSKNMISIRILEAIEPSYAQEWITHFGFDADKHPAYLTMALGSGSVTPLQIASGYGVFATGGHRVNPYLITKVTDSKGNILSEAKEQGINENSRVISARNAFVMSSLLQEVTRSGTAARAQAALKRPDIYGKTGTTNDSLDAWFGGYSQTVSAAVWIGYDTPRKLGAKETGGGLSLPVWIDYMSHTLKGVPVAEFKAPEGVVNVGGEWYYQEYARGGGVTSLGLDDKATAPPSDEEKKGILDLFKN
jgi:penicillin-binding protein 1A